MVAHFAPHIRNSLLRLVSAKGMQLLRCAYAYMGTWQLTSLQKWRFDLSGSARWCR